MLHHIHLLLFQTKLPKQTPKNCMLSGFDVFILGEIETFFFIVSISICVVIVVVHFAAAATLSIVAFQFPAAATLCFLCQDLYTALILSPSYLWLNSNVISLIVTSSSWHLRRWLNKSP
ncbi:hypothetical protein CARUB_v10007883mg [Capsella rubella]|uniref:Uncharacterized protein n=1 Tax=Capsella rubella TaxID=81985 RepID=R0GQN7_9BRAS|nr:hypothetical protein CARUB_v10007883mg [Capsella rubella]